MSGSELTGLPPSCLAEELRGIATKSNEVNVGAVVEHIMTTIRSEARTAALGGKFEATVHFAGGMPSDEIISLVKDLLKQDGFNRGCIIPNCTEHADQYSISIRW